MTGNTAKVTKGMNFVQEAVQRPSINVGRGDRLISKINLLQINNLKAKRAFFLKHLPHLKMNHAYRFIRSIDLLPEI